MWQFKQGLLGTLSVLALSGCATSALPVYAPPAVSNIENSHTYQTPFDVTWDKLVKNLSSDFFVINNIDKNSRLINVSFSTQNPSEYIDCGETTRTFKNAQGEQNYQYKVANSSEFLMANAQGHVTRVQRRTKLEGRMNIYVAPEDTKTLVTVNTKYILSIEVRGAMLGGPVFNPEVVTADFSTKAPYVGPVFSCHAKGNIEARVHGFLAKS